MAGYMIGDGRVIHWRGQAMAGGREVPAEYIAELSAEALAAMLAEGALVELAPKPAAKARR